MLTCFFNRLLECLLLDLVCVLFIVVLLCMLLEVVCVLKALAEDGELTLSFQQEYPPSLGECSVRKKVGASYWCSTGDGRGNSVAEVWLRPVTNA